MRKKSFILHSSLSGENPIADFWSKIMPFFNQMLRLSDIQGKIMAMIYDNVFTRAVSAKSVARGLHAHARLIFQERTEWD